jgi:hypothetical protein
VKARVENEETVATHVREIRSASVKERNLVILAYFVVSLITVLYTRYVRLRLRPTCILNLLVVRVAVLSV